MDEEALDEVEDATEDATEDLEEPSDVVRLSLKGGLLRLNELATRLLTLVVMKKWFLLIAFARVVLRLGSWRRRRRRIRVIIVPIVLLLPPLFHLLVRCRLGHCRRLFTRGI